MTRTGWKAMRCAHIERRTSEAGNECDELHFYPVVGRDRNWYARDHLLRAGPKVGWGKHKANDILGRDMNHERYGELKGFEFEGAECWCLIAEEHKRHHTYYRVLKTAPKEAAPWPSPDDDFGIEQHQAVQDAIDAWAADPKQGFNIPFDE